MFTGRCPTSNSLGHRTVHCIPLQLQSFHFDNAYLLRPYSLSLVCLTMLYRHALILSPCEVVLRVKWRTTVTMQVQYQDDARLLQSTFAQSSYADTTEVIKTVATCNFIC